MRNTYLAIAAVIFSLLSIGTTVYFAAKALVEYEKALKKYEKTLQEEERYE